MNLTAKKIQLSRRVYDYLKQCALQEPVTKKKILKIKACASWAVNFHIGIYNDIELENALIEISNENSIGLNNHYDKNTYLHVMTKTKAAGGHTSIVINWIKSSLHSTEKHSVFFTDQLKGNTPNILSDVVLQSNGEVLYNNNTNKIKLFKTLRTVASNYEHIILHTHMDDVIPILAFGNQNFNRPVTFYNHADHLYWLGVSIIDHIYELSSDGADFTIENRGRLHSSVLPIPIEIIQKNESFELEDLKSLNIHDNTKVIVTIASAHKFKSVQTIHFTQIAKQIVENVENTIFLIIGPSIKETIWKEIYDKTNGKVVPLGIKHRSFISKLIPRTDLYIDSYPYRSYTSFLEFASYGIPALSLDNRRNTLDVMKNVNVIQEDIDILVKASTSILTGKIKFSNQLSMQVNKTHNINGLWYQELKQLEIVLPQIHQVSLDNFVQKVEINNNDWIVYTAQLNTFGFFSFLLPLSLQKISILLKLFIKFPHSIFFLLNQIKKRRL